MGLLLSTFEIKRQLTIIIIDIAAETTISKNGLLSNAKFVNTDDKLLYINNAIGKYRVSCVRRIPMYSPDGDYH